MAPMGESIDAVHIGACLFDNCPHKHVIIEKVKAKTGVDVIGLPSLQTCTSIWQLTQ